MPDRKMPRRTLTLTQEEANALVHISRKDPRAYMREKADALLAIARGMSPYQVATSALSKLKETHKPDTVYQWLNDFQKHRKLLPRPATRKAFSPSRPTTGADPKSPAPAPASSLPDATVEPGLTPPILPDLEYPKDP